MDRLLGFECEEAVWYCSVSIRYCVHSGAGGKFGNKYGYIQDNNPDRNERDYVGGIVIFIRYHNKVSYGCVFVFLILLGYG